MGERSRRVSQEKGEGLMEERENTGTSNNGRERERTGEKTVNVRPNNGNKFWVESRFKLAIESQNSPSVVFKFGIGPTLNLS